MTRAPAAPATDDAANDATGNPGGQIRSVIDLWSVPRVREAAGYLQVSILATVFDVAVFTALMFSGLVSSTVAGSTSYLVALVVHYLIAVRLVFKPERTGKSRRRLAIEYIATGFVGVSITAVAIYTLTTYFGVWAYAAKAVGIGTSFFAVYAMRSFLVFKPDPAAAADADALAVAAQATSRAMTNYECIRQELSSRSHLKVTSGRSIAVLLPCRNEAAAIAGTIAEFRKALPTATIYVYDNNSEDRTSEIARAAGAVVRFESYHGKGNVVRRMLADIDADIYVLADGDMTYDASAAGFMVEQLVTQNLDMVVGTRVAETDAAFPTGHRFGNRLFNIVVKNLFGNQFSDILSGYRVLSRRFAKSFPAASSGFEIETELSVHALDLRLQTVEIALHYKERPANTVSKLRTYTDGMHILLTIVRMYRWLRPRQFYGSIGAVFAIASLGFGAIVIVEFWMTGRVSRLPTALLATALGQLAILSLAIGLILEATSRGQREVRRMHYLDLPAPAATEATTGHAAAHPSTPTAAAS